MKKTVQKGFINEVSESEIIVALRLMEASPAYLTKPSYRGSSERWTNDYTSFVDYHLNYLRLHPSLDPYQYISNLKLMLKKGSH